MSNQLNNSENLNADQLIVFLYKWKKPLLLLTFIGAVVSIIVSLLIENKYKSTAIIFPTTTGSVSKALISENATGREDILRFGEDEEAEQLLQILHSDEIRNKIIDKYNLSEHYDIGEEVKFKMTQLQKEYERNVTFKRTKFTSIEISVLDHDPNIAANIANDIVALLDTVKNRMRKEIAQEALAIVSKEYENQMDYINLLEDSLEVLGKFGVIDVESQTERLTEQLARAILQGNKNAAAQLEEKLQNLSKYAGTFTNIQNQLWSEKKRLSFMRTKHQEAQIDAETDLQHKFVVNRAFPAEKKSYPIRWLIVVVSTFATFLLTLVIILFVERIKSAKIGLLK